MHRGLHLAIACFCRALRKQIVCVRSTWCWCRQNFYHSKRHLLHGIPTKYCSNTIFLLDFLWFHVVVVVAGYLDGCSCKTIFYQVLLQALSLNRSTPTTKTTSEHCLRLGGGRSRRIMAEVVYVPFLPPMFHIMNIMFTTCCWYHTKNKNDFFPSIEMKTLIWTITPSFD